MPAVAVPRITPYFVLLVADGSILLWLVTLTVWVTTTVSRLADEVFDELFPSDGHALF